MVEGEWGMRVSEGFMTRRAVALELVSAVQDRVTGELFIYVWVEACEQVRVFRPQSFRSFRLEVHKVFP